MKKYWVALFVTLCLSSLAFTQIALGEDTSPNANSTTPAVSTEAATLKKSWTASTAPSHRCTAKGVPNFGRLNDNIWRSGQPSREGYEGLAKQGLKTVVNLRQEFPADKDLIPEGVQYVYIPIKDEHEPTAEQAKQFIAVASNPDNWPLLVHCAGGEGRAGVMSGLVRSSLDGWKLEKIMNEVGNFRIKLLGISIPMASCQRNFLRRWDAQKDPVSKEETQKEPAGGKEAPSADKSVP